MAIVLAMLIDRWLGEPPRGLHPVVWMGRYLGWIGKRLTACRPGVAFTLGMAAWLAGAAIVAVVYAYARVLVAECPRWLAVLVTALLLKPLFALRMLLGEVSAVEQALGASLESGRERLRGIVSRDTTRLDAGEVRESALESLAENLSDSVVAPLFWFVLFGLPGAAVYRFANTADAMWGYRGKWEWAGKFAARADDVLNLIPARITALALVLFGRNRCRRRQVLRRLPREAARTPSPNSGWPMAALALSLGIRLRKPGVYGLNEQGAAPTAADVAAALRRSELVAWLLAVLAAATPLLLGITHD
ncbi:MAG TPA: adenosylcobinamide-phosphate synthase CbiB [Steroidobacteraceae bacterium]|nr:adenosylcobinamide-phosphate synthase CbiB [Steroidobacteraceae bacterium]